MSGGYTVYGAIKTHGSELQGPRRSSMHVHLHAYLTTSLSILHVASLQMLYYNLAHIKAITYVLISIITKGPVTLLKSHTGC